MSEKVQLGENVRATGIISPKAFQRGIDCLDNFKSLMAQYPLEQYWALGTNTFRVTDNAQEFIEASRAIGIDISIISGVQEAVLIYAGVITSLPLTGAHRLVFDIGGGSTEIILGQRHERMLTESMAIGSVVWRDRFFSQEDSSSAHLEQQMDKGLSAARSVFDAVAPGVNRIGWDEVYASSGTVKMLAAICQEHGYGEQQIQLGALKALKPAMANCIANGSELPGMKERRRDLLLSGWCIMAGLMESYNIATVNFSSTALREGMLDFMVKNEKTIQAMERSNLPGVNCASS